MEDIYLGPHIPILFLLILGVPYVGVPILVPLNLILVARLKSRASGARGQVSQQRRLSRIVPLPHVRGYDSAGASTVSNSMTPHTVASVSYASNMPGDDVGTICISAVARISTSSAWMPCLLGCLINLA